MVLSNNSRTINGIQDNTERYIWITYLIVVLLSSLVGDTVILVASIRYKAFKLNKFIVVVIQHLAVCDLLASLAFSVPTLTAMIADRWVLGGFLVYVERFTVHLSFPLCNALMCVLTSSKLLLLRSPLRTRQWTEKRAHVVCIVCWVVATVYSAAKLLHYRNRVYFNYATYNIDYNSDKWFSITADSVYLLMIMVVLITTVLTLNYLYAAREVARRVQKEGSLRWHGILTVVLTATVFLLSTGPWTLHRIAEPFLSPAPHNIFFHTTLKRLAEYFSMLSVASNFYIYCVTVPSFRELLLSGYPPSRAEGPQ
jgi:hypothetical protein